jgi:sugar lactone lactonase YvrE
LAEISRIVPGGALLGECPVWDAKAEVLWWVDIEGRRIHRYDATFAVDSHQDVPGRPGAIALTGQFNRLLVAMENELVWFDWDEANLDSWLQLEPPDTGNRLNDAVCDRNGRFWVGSMSETPAATGRLHCVKPSGAYTTTQRGIHVANGLAFSPDSRTMYFADSHRRTVWAYDYEVETGRTSAERVFLEFGTELPGKPDGAAVDEAGCYWVACVYGWSIARVDPKGRIDRLVELPVEKPTKPAFGGKQLDVLYVTTIGSGGSEPTVTHQHDDGAVFALDVGVSGIAEPRFAGRRASGDD